MSDSEDSTSNEYFIMIEQDLLLKTARFDEALFLLLAVHYVFDLQYDVKVKEILTFLQEYVSKLKCGKVNLTATYAAVSTRLLRASKQ